ncbi:uncharacterized protein BX664DRAFT_381314 [Halteromyces radiatus]|uniref:uncharacterized protein n=1 Tax=Halteromyces radiatus TaxID=101107 RepID=UPI00221E8067|nr:uncharacterized protein BX664DRAFT_381314 [Halteromyces radiatus]KAI8098626.1 hypothetical protein BX664DRAFT_381314 [Halteromyces radiatus]
MLHEDTWYDYKTALNLKHPVVPAIADQHHGQHTSLNVKFDNVQDASGFMKAVFQPRGGRRMYAPEMSFVNPRNPDMVSKDYNIFMMNELRRRRQHEGGALPPSLDPYYDYSSRHHRINSSHWPQTPSYHHSPRQSSSSRKLYVVPSKRPRYHHIQNDDIEYYEQSELHTSAQEPRYFDGKASYYQVNYNNAYSSNQQFNENEEIKHNGHEDSTEEEEEEEEEVTPQEQEALRNAELNKVVKVNTISEQHSSNNGTLWKNNMNDLVSSNLRNIDLTSTMESTTATTTTRKEATVVTGKPTKKRHDKAFRVLISFFRKLRSRKQQDKNGQRKRKIQTMWVTAPVGDVMDQQQQQEVMDMLSRSSNSPFSKKKFNKSSGIEQEGIDLPTPHDNATKVAELDHIWVFRCITTSQNQQEDSGISTIWTGFDYENQLMLSQHCENDEGIELFDTHIRHGQLPILVIPKRQICFYSASHLPDDQVASLQVACIPNSEHLQFVYRCGPSVC